MSVLTVGDFRGFPEVGCETWHWKSAWFSAVN